MADNNHKIAYMRRGKEIKDSLELLISSAPHVSFGANIQKLLERNARRSVSGKVRGRWTEQRSTV